MTFVHSDEGQISRRGFKFSDTNDKKYIKVTLVATFVGTKKSRRPAKDNTFVFRARENDEEEKVSKQHTADTAAASTALRAKQEKVEKG